jgi:hypothetical protein
MQTQTLPWQPYREPLRTTLLRTGTIALVVGAALAPRFGGLAPWPAAVLLVLWFSFGGHWVEVCFLNVLRPRLPAARPVQIAARLAVWFAGGVVLAAGMKLTAIALGARPANWPLLYLGGLAFIAVEFIAHAALMLRRRPNVYDGHG